MLGALWQQVKDELIKRRSSFSRHFLPHHLFVANDYYSLTFFHFARLRLISLKGILFLSLFCFSFFWKTKQQVVNVTLCTLLACLTRLKVSKSPKNKLHPVWSSEVIFVFVETSRVVFIKLQNYSFKMISLTFKTQHSSELNKHTCFL